MLSGEQLDQFKEHGFCLVSGVLIGEALTTVQHANSKVVSLARAGLVNPIRVYEDYPRFGGLLNLAGIEDPFFNVPESVDALTNTDLRSILLRLTGWVNADLELARIHTNGKFKYRGFWHRDALLSQSDSSVVVVVYLTDEDGFIITSTKAGVNVKGLSGDLLQTQRSVHSVEGEFAVAAKAGDAFFFRSYLLHRGCSVKPRQHLHLRFTETENLDINPASWAKYRNSKAESFDRSSNTRWSRIRNLARYCVPSSTRSSLFQ